MSLMLSFSAFAVELEGIDWDDNLSEKEYNLIYNKENYDNSFVLGEVIVVLKKGIPEDIDYKALFPELDILEIKVLFAETETRRTTLLVIFEEKTKETVIEAIELLKKNSVVYVSEPNYIYEIFAPVLKGDANCDGSIANDDLILVARHIVGLVEFNYNQRLNADFDNDNEVTNTDLISIAKMIVSVE